MRKVELMANEQNRYEIIKSVVDNNGNKKRAAIKLGCSVRTVNRWIKVYKEEGKAGFVHGNRGKSPAIKFPEDVKRKIIEMYKNDYLDTNFAHFAELVEADMDVKISPRTINNWLREEEFILSPKAKRTTKAKMRKALKELEKQATKRVEKNKVKVANELLDASTVHARRPRRKNEGEMIQMDASSYEWVSGETWHLHVAVDDASGKIVGAYFDTQETLKGYYNVLYQILTNYGIPYMFYTDKRTVFEYKRKNTPQDADDTYTQFSYACKQLGTVIKTTSVAPAKGRVERLNQTLQSRLPVDMRRSNIKTIEQANEFLTTYIKKHNEKFALQVKSSRNVYEAQPSVEEINQILAVISHRKIDCGNSIKFKKKYYLPTDECGQIKYFQSKKECLVIECFDGSLYMSIDNNIYIAKEVLEHDTISPDFDVAPPAEKKERKKYIPPKNHPWRLQSFKKHANQQRHRELI